MPAHPVLRPQSLLFHASLHTRAYPWLKDASELWLHTVSKHTDLGWNYAYLETVLRAVHRFTGSSGGTAGGSVGRAMKALFQEDFPHTAGTATHCFEQVALVGMATSEFGYFADQWEAGVFRKLAWAHHGLLPPPSALGANAKLRMFMVERETGKTRRLLNKDDILQKLLATGLVDIDYLPGNVRAVQSFEGASFRQQLQWMQHTDVLIGVHGGGLNNGIFMNKGKPQ
jgi:hypothetical protein